MSPVRVVIATLFIVFLLICGVSFYFRGRNEWDDPLGIQGVWVGGNGESLLVLSGDGCGFFQKAPSQSLYKIKWISNQDVLKISFLSIDSGFSNEKQHRIRLSDNRSHLYVAPGIEGEYTFSRR